MLTKGIWSPHTIKKKKSISEEYGRQNEKSLKDTTISSFT